RGDRLRVDSDVAVLLARDTTAAQLISEHRITRAFVRTLLEQEELTRKVERAVTRGRADVGFEVHIRRYSIPTGSGRSTAQALQDALDLATDGKPSPGTAVRTEWVAPLRLNRRLRLALSTAEPNQYVGPFYGRSGYLVIQLLGKGRHRYGRPARIALEAKYFRSW